MREILEDAAIYYRQEAESFLIIAAPAFVLGPTLVIVAASSLEAGLLTIPALLLVYFGVHAACVRAAGLTLDNQEPDPARVYLDVLLRVHRLALITAPGIALAGIILASVLILRDQGLRYIALGVGLLGAVAWLYWAARHSFEAPLMLAHDLGFRDCRISGLWMAERRPLWLAFVLAAVSAPLLVAALIAWGLAAGVKPVFGAAVFASAVGLWLPLAAFAITDLCERYADDMATAEREPA